MAKKRRIDKELGIRSAKGLGTYLANKTSADVIAIKTATSCIKVIWPVQNKLHTIDIPGSILYVEVQEVEEAIETIKATL